MSPLRVTPLELEKSVTVSKYLLIVTPNAQKNLPTGIHSLESLLILEDITGVTFSMFRSPPQGSIRISSKDLEVCVCVFMPNVTKP